MTSAPRRSLARLLARAICEIAYGKHSPFRRRLTNRLADQRMRDENASLTVDERLARLPRNAREAAIGGIYVTEARHFASDPSLSDAEARQRIATAMSRMIAARAEAAQEARQVLARRASACIERRADERTGQASARERRSAPARRTRATARGPDSVDPPDADSDGGPR